MAVNPVAFEDDFDAVVSRTRQAIASRGENRAKARGEFQSPLPAEERQAVMSLLRDGTYAAAAGRVAVEDPDFADQ